MPRGKFGGEERVALSWADGALKGIGSGDRRSLIGGDLQGYARTFDIGRSLQHRDLRRLVRRAYDDVVIAGGGEANGTARGLHRPGLIRGEIDQMERQFALRRHRPQAAVIQAGDVELGSSGQGDPAGGNLQFRAGGWLGPERIAGADREVSGGGAPLRIGAGAERYRAGQAGDAPDPGWRIALVLIRLRGR
jgi:hypothetical protein